MIKQFGIAALHLGQRSPGQRGLNAQDGLGLGGGDFRRIPQQLEHLLDMGHVGLAKLHGFRIRIEVVVAVGKAQPALVHLGDHLGRIFVILVRLEGERDVQARHGGNDPRHFALGAHAADSFQIALQRAGSSGLDCLFIHAGAVVVADLLFHRIAARAARRRFLENLAQQRPVLVRQLAADAPAGLVRRDRVFLQPAPACVSEKVGAGIHAGVEGSDVEDRRVGRCGALRVGAAGTRIETMTARASAIRNIILLGAGEDFGFQNLDFRFQNLDSGDGASSINLQSKI